MKPVPALSETVLSLRGWLCAALVALAVGCGGGAGEDRSAATGPIDDAPAYGDAIGAEASAMLRCSSPCSPATAHRMRSPGMIFDGMIAYDKNLSEFEPRLAESWEVSENGLEITFHLRHDVRWQDGTPFTARDVEYGFRTITDPNTLTAYAEDYRQVEAFEVLDDYTFRVKYEPFAPALAAGVCLIVLPRQFSEGRPINDRRRTSAGKPIGSGCTGSNRGNTEADLVAQRIHDYYRGRPYIERAVRG